MSVERFLEQLLDGAGVEWKALGDVAVLKRGRVMSKIYLAENAGDFPVYSSQTAQEGMIGKIGTFDFYGDFVSWTTDGANAGTVFYRTGKFSITNVCGIIKSNKQFSLNIKFLFYWLSVKAKKHVRSGMGNPKLMSHQVEKILVPIPCPDDPEKSLAIQREIVRRLDAFTELTTELTTRKKQYNHYRDQLLTFDDGEVEWKTLDSVFNIFAGGDKPKDAFSEIETEEFNVPILSNGIGDKSLYGWTSTAKINEPSLTVSARGTIGWTSYRDRPIFPIIRLIVLMPKTRVNLKYAYYFMKTIEDKYAVPDAGIPQLTKPMINKTLFPIPHPNDPEKSLSEQARIVAILDKFDALTTSLTDGLPREIELREKQYEYYRDQLLNFPKPEEAAA